MAEETANPVTEIDNLVYNPELVNTNVNPTQSNEPIDSNPTAPEGEVEDDGMVYNADLNGPDVIRDNVHDINVEEYAGELGFGNQDVYMPEGPDPMGVLNQTRADEQGFFEQAGGFLAQSIVGEIVGGTFEGLGYLADIGSVLDLMRGQETEWGNFMTEFGQGIREKTEAATRIHTDPSAEGFAKMGDSGWWFSNGVSIASTLSMLIPTAGAMRAASFIGKGVAASKGFQASKNAMKAANKIKNMSQKQKWMTKGISQAVLSRNIENWMEAHGTFEGHKAELLEEINPETGEKFTVDEATMVASKSAASNWKKGWAMLLQDIPQYLAIGKVFNPVSKRMEKALTGTANKGIMSNLKPWQQKVAGGLGTFASEGFEESYQYMIAEQSKFKADLDAGLIDDAQYRKKVSEALGSEEMWTSAFFGGLGGNLFQAAGSGINSAFKSKDQKEYEKNIGAYYQEAVKNDAARVGMLFQHLNKIDSEKASPEARKAVIDEMMMGMTINALESNQFELFYETLSNMAEMSEEDRENFKKVTEGEEFSNDLAKEYVPEVQKRALEFRDRYFKHRNQYEHQTAAKLTKLELENSNLETILEKTSNDANIARKGMGTVWAKASDTVKTKMELRDRGTILRRRKKALTAQIKEEEKNGSPERVTFLEKALDRNESLLKQQAKDTKAATEARKALPAEEKMQIEAENDSVLSAYHSRRQDVLRAMESKAKAEEMILVNNEDMVWAQSEEGRAKVKARQLYKELNTEGAYDTVEDIDKGIEKVKKAEYMTGEEETKAIEALEARKVIVKAKIEREAAAAKRAATAEALRAKNAAQNENPATADNQNRPEVEDVLEDENADNESTTEIDQIESAEKTDKENSKDLIALLDQVDNTDAYKEWAKLPYSKVGEVFTYSIPMAGINDNQNQAISDFNKLVKSGAKPEDIPQSVFDHLPIQAVLDSNSNVKTYLPNKPGETSSEEKKQKYKEGYPQERINIISRLLLGEKVSAEVKLNSGGDLNSYFDRENNVVPEHSLLSIMQIKGMDDIADLLRYSDKNGFLRDMQKSVDPGFSRGMNLKDLDDKGNPMPYRGGVYLKIKKANGKPFALKLNIKKNTQEQAEIIAELLIRTVVPVAVRKDGQVQLNEAGVQIVRKELTYQTRLSELEDDLQSAIKQQMEGEIKMLGGDPNVGELIDTFAYVSVKTEGLSSELYFDKNDLVYGGKRVDLINRNTDETWNDIVKFLRYKKRRQISINSWNENQSYRDYVIENNILSTNLRPDEPAFHNTRDRGPNGKMYGKRIQMYLQPTQPIGGAKPSGITTTADGELVINQDDFSDVKEPTFAGFSAEEKEDFIGDFMVKAELDYFLDTFGDVGGDMLSIGVPAMTEQEMKDFEKWHEGSRGRAESAYDAEVAKRKPQTSKVETKKDNIERRRQEANKNIIQVENNLWNSNAPESENVFDTIEGKTKKEVQNKIKAKYDVELATLESQPKPQTSEVKISPYNMVSIMDLKTPTQPGINRILGLDLTDESAINFLEKKGIISKMEGAKGRRFLKSKEEALSILEPGLQASKVVKAPLEGVLDATIAEMSDENYKELVETGYTQYLDGEDTIEVVYNKPKKKVSKSSDTQIRKDSKKTLPSKPSVKKPSVSYDESGEPINVNSSLVEKMRQMKAAKEAKGKGKDTGKKNAGTTPPKYPKFGRSGVANLNTGVTEKPPNCKS